MKRTRIIIYYHPHKRICMIKHTGELVQDISLREFINYLHEWEREMRTH